MFKKRYFSINNDFRTGFYCKFFLFIGILFLVISLFFKICSYVIGENSSGFILDLLKFSQSNIPNSILAFSIIFFAFAVIFYFFNCQFSKLAKIVEDIENSEDFDEMENTEKIKETENLEKNDNFENK